MKLHVPILIQEILSMMPEKMNWIFDGTVGHGGHALAMLQKTLGGNPSVQLVGTDRDEQMLMTARHVLSEYSDRIELIHDSYTAIPQIIAQKNILFDVILVDLGINRGHIRDEQRGFSFKSHGELDMRFDTQSGISAQQILATYTLEQLTAMFVNFADIPHKSAQMISKMIIDERKKKKIITVADFGSIFHSHRRIQQMMPQIFQSLRIEANQELDHVEKFLSEIEKSLSPGGRCMVITFHSIEDRLVKNIFKQLEEQGKINIITKHVIKPTYQEVQQNKASRSAKLRVIENLSH